MNVTMFFHGFSNKIFIKDKFMFTVIVRVKLNSSLSYFFQIHCLVFSLFFKYKKFLKTTKFAFNNNFYFFCAANWRSNSTVILGDEPGSQILIKTIIFFFCLPFIHVNFGKWQQLKPIMPLIIVNVIWIPLCLIRRLRVSKWHFVPKWRHNWKNVYFWGHHRSSQWPFTVHEI